MNGRTHPLIGSWRLRDWIAIDDDGGSVRPMGSRPEGLLVYSEDGTMVGIMGPAGRPRLSSDDVTGGTVEERAQAFETFIAYGGAYEIAGSDVIHRVKTSLFPNWIGTEQRRRWELDPHGSTLTLISPALRLGNAARVQRLTWERTRRGDP